jgi:hypothetical protein
MHTRVSGDGSERGEALARFLIHSGLACAVGLVPVHPSLRIDLKRSPESILALLRC